MTLKGQTRDLNTLRAQYLENYFSWSHQIWYAALYRECLAGAQIIFPESGRGVGHVTLQFLAVRSAILATAWLLVYYLQSDSRLGWHFLSRFLCCRNLLSSVLLGAMFVRRLFVDGKLIVAVGNFVAQQKQTFLGNLPRKVCFC